MYQVIHLQTGYLTDFKAEFDTSKIWHSQTGKSQLDKFTNKRKSSQAHPGCLEVSVSSRRPDEQRATCRLQVTSTCETSDEGRNDGATRSVPSG